MNSQSLGYKMALRYEEYCVTTSSDEAALKLVVADFSSDFRKLGMSLTLPEVESMVRSGQRLITSTITSCFQNKQVF